MLKGGFLLLLLFFTLTFRIVAHGEPQGSEWDPSIVKVENQIYFLSDLNSLVLEIVKIRNSGEDSILLKISGLQTSQWPIIPNLTDKNLAENMPFIQKLLRLIKVKHFLATQEGANKGEKILRERFQDSSDLFMSTLNRQMSHEILFRSKQK